MTQIFSRKEAAEVFSSSYVTRLPSANRLLNIATVTSFIDVELTAYWIVREAHTLHAKKR